MRKTIICVKSVFLTVAVRALVADAITRRLPVSVSSSVVTQRSKMHEVEMDENKVVVHTRRGSTAVGVTPSDPSAIVDLFQEVESIGKDVVSRPEKERDIRDKREAKRQEGGKDGLRERERERVAVVGGRCGRFHRVCCHARPRSSPKYRCSVSLV